MGHKEDSLKYYYKNKEKILFSQKEWYNKNKEYLKKQNNERQKQRTIRLRNLLLEKFGKICACCKLDIPQLLTIDHIKRNGHIERKKIPNALKLRQYILDYGSKDEYQTLCHNCNWAYGVYGKCFH